MTPEIVTSAVWIAIKIMTIIGLGIYCLFGGIMVRQEWLMAHSFKESTEPILRLLALIHLGAALLLLVLSFFII